MLTGQAKKLYQREYMRTYMQTRRSVKTHSVKTSTAGVRAIDNSLRPVKTPLRPTVQSVGPSPQLQELVKPSAIQKVTGLTEYTGVKPKPPLYVQGKKYAPGTEVRDINGRIFTAPELDGNGQPVPED